ncbi:MAG: GNAT family N-acetyltransferase [Alphaproteobacteria bacterium]|nr:GNAT family N-acetyltransferase [Alphaproteobacteria bacterium]
MTCPPAVSVPLLTAGDLDAVTILVRTLKWPHRREDVDLFMRLGRGRIVRDDADGRMMGVALWWTFGDQLARLGLVMIDPQSQGRGIGRRLVEQILTDSAGRTMVLLATEAGLPLYEKLGFLTIGGNRQIQGTYSEAPSEDPVIRPATSQDLPAILALDLTASGADRVDLLQALTDIGRTFVQVNQGRITGYAIERPFGRGSTVGPIVAESEQDAIRLFRAAARPGFTRVDCPSDAPDFAAHLQAGGLVAIEGESPVMVRGSWRPPENHQRIFALSSHALG